jgi:hypothetical protein
MQFGLFGSAAARRGGPEFDSSEGFRDFIDYNIEAEALGFHSSFIVEHHFTGYGQVSATINLLTWLGARTRWLRLGTAVMVLPWHNPVLLPERQRPSISYARAPQPPERPALGVGEAVVGPLPCIIQLLASRQREPATGLWVYIFRIHGFPSTIGPPGRAPRIRQSIGPSGLPMRAM